MLKLITDGWPWLTWGASLLREVLPYMTFAGVMWTVWKLARDRRKVTIVAVSAASGERSEVARLPAQMVTRAEVLGLVAQAAGGERLDFSLFQFDYRFRTEIEVRLPEASYTLLRREEPRPPTTRALTQPLPTAPSKPL